MYYIFYRTYVQVRAARLGGLGAKEQDMDTFITVFNANRHWILPIMLAVVGGLLVREVRIFFQESGLGGPAQLPCVAEKSHKPRAGIPFLTKGVFAPMPGKTVRPGLQFGGAMLFHESRYNGQK